MLCFCIIDISTPLLSLIVEIVKLLPCICSILFFMTSGWTGNIRNLILRFLGQKYDFCRSGLMNARLSVHYSLKRAIGKTYKSCMLGSTLAARLSVLG